MPRHPENGGAGAGDAGTRPFRDLLDRARAGDAAARDHLFERIYPRLERIARWQMACEVRQRRPWLAAQFATGDVVQDVCQRVLADLPSFQADSERALVAYLAVAVRNRMTDALRFHEALRRDCRRAAPDLDELELRAPSPGPATHALQADLAATFWRLAARLSAREQQLLRQRIEDEDTFDAIARDLAFPSADAARKAFYAVQARLLVLLRQAGIEPGRS
ncbi:MAG: sigma-70 family RNA polymerase sigma factor [Planctomycetes bacterium]|nr:sigma-70 family RNA polymerase sigma factor [Planctomycetota bacterium]